MSCIPRNALDPFAVGDRIELVSMPDDPDPIKPGEQGAVTSCTYLDFFGTPHWQIGVAWDSGRTLMLTMPPDQAKKVS